MTQEKEKWSPPPLILIKESYVQQKPLSQLACETIISLREISDNLKIDNDKSNLAAKAKDKFSFLKEQVFPIINSFVLNLPFQNKKDFQIVFVRNRFLSKNFSSISIVYNDGCLNLLTTGKSNPRVKPIESDKALKDLADNRSSPKEKLIANAFLELNKATILNKAIGTIEPYTKIR